MSNDIIAILIDALNNIFAISVKQIGVCNENKIISVDMPYGNCFKS